MNATTSLGRIALLVALAATAFLLIFTEEQDTALIPWTLHVAADKLIGIAAAILAARLYRRWGRRDPWLKAYDRMCRHVAEAPNPSQF